MEGPPRTYEAIRQRLVPPDGPRPEVFYSLLGRMDVGVGLQGAARAPLARAYDEFLESPGVYCLPFDRDAADLAAQLRATLRLKTPDAIHAAIAITGGCDEFWTGDRRLARLEPRIRVMAV